MGFFDFLRKKKEEKKKEESENAGNEKVSFLGIEKWIETKLQGLKEKEKFALNSIQERANFLEETLKEKIKAVQNFDLSSKKETERIKSAVEEGRKKYLESVEYLIESLNDINKERLEKSIEDAGKVFSDFNKRSRKSFERATILIGKEMGEIRRSLNEFSGSLAEIFNQNKEVVESYNRVSLIKFKLTQFEKVKKEIKNAESELIFLESEIVKKEKENIEILENLNEIKKSPEYTKIKESEEKIKILKKDLENNLLSLRNLIDFKALGSFYHIFEGKMKIVKAYRENFNENFEKDNGKTILYLLDEAKLKSEEIQKKFKEIENKKEEISTFETKLKDEKKKDKTGVLAMESERLIFEINDSKNKNSWAKKRLENLKKDREEILHEIKETLGKFGADLN